MPCQNKNTQFWHIDTSNRIKSKSDQNYCINLGDELSFSDLKGLQMKASSCANDNQHNLQNVIDESDNFYMSIFNDEHVYIEFIF